MAKAKILPSWRSLAAQALCEARATLATEPYVAGRRLEATYRRAAISRSINPWYERKNAAIRPVKVLAGDYLGSKCDWN